MSSSTPAKVYFVENVETGRIKVGFTISSVNKRVKTLQTGSDCELRLLGVIVANYDEGTTELQLHRRFAQWRHRGEWFTEDVLPFVREILQQAAAERDA